MRFTANGKLNPGEFWPRSKSPARNRAFCVCTFVCSVALVVDQRFLFHSRLRPNLRRLSFDFAMGGGEREERERERERKREHDPLNKPNRWNARRIESTSFQSLRLSHSVRVLSSLSNPLQAAMIEAYISLLC